MLTKIKTKSLDTLFLNHVYAIHFIGTFIILNLIMYYIEEIHFI